MKARGRPKHTRTLWPSRNKKKRKHCSEKENQEYQNSDKLPRAKRVCVDIKQVPQEMCTSRNSCLSDETKIETEEKGVLCTFTCSYVCPRILAATCGTFYVTTAYICTLSNDLYFVNSFTIPFIVLYTSYMKVLIYLAVRTRQFQMHITMDR